MHGREGIFACLPNLPRWSSNRSMWSNNNKIHNIITNGQNEAREIEYN